MNINKAIILGRLGRDPEVRYTQSGKAVASFSVATSKTWKDQSGQKQTQTEWHKVVVWGVIAENCGKYLRKGSGVFVEGEITTRKWTDKQGQDRYTTEINAHSVQFIDAKKADEPKASDMPKAGEEVTQEMADAYMRGDAVMSEADIPF